MRPSPPYVIDVRSVRLHPSTDFNHVGNSCCHQKHTQQTSLPLSVRNSSIRLRIKYVVRSIVSRCVLDGSPFSSRLDNASFSGHLKGDASSQFDERRIPRYGMASHSTSKRFSRRTRAPSELSNSTTQARISPQRTRARHQVLPAQHEQSHRVERTSGSSSWFDILTR